MVKIKDDNQKINWGYKDTNKVKSTIVNNDEELTGNDKFTTLKTLHLKLHTKTFMMM